jgi:hypothetical protein
MTHLSDHVNLPLSGQPCQVFSLLFACAQKKEPAVARAAATTDEDSADLQ